MRELATVNPIRSADIGAAISSGSFPTMGMIIAPCSIRTMSEIATGVTATLLSRAADVVLKEKRRLVLAVRETPLHGGHLRTMTTLADIGAVIAPIVPAFYNRPKIGRRHHQSHLRPPARPVRHRHRHGQTLEGRPGGGLSFRRAQRDPNDARLERNCEAVIWIRMPLAASGMTVRYGNVKGRNTMDQKRYDIGLAKRKQVLGDAYVDRALDNVDDFNRDFQRIAHRILLGRDLGRRDAANRASARSSISA